MNKKLLLPLFITALTEATSAQASFTLIAQAGLTGLYDLSTATSGPLESGVAGNTLGGLGSGLAWAGGTAFIATPDRGPNALAYNASLEDTTSYITRFQTLNMSLTANSGSGLAFTLTPTLTATTLLSSPTALTYGIGGTPALNATNNTNYFTGRSDGFDPSLPSSNTNNARFDPEGVRVSNDGKSVFISDEYGPYVRQFDRTTGELIKTFALPDNLAVAVQGPTTVSENGTHNTTGRVANKGMEGLAITPDGKKLIGIMQAPLLQDTKKNVRIVTIDIATGDTHEYAYQLTTGSGVSEIIALNEDEFLVGERDGKGLGDGTAAVAKELFKINLSTATEVSSLSGDLSIQSATINKISVLDVKAILVANGISADKIPAKIEGLAFGEDVTVAGQLLHTLYVSSDNDFLSTAVASGITIANPSMFYVFGFTDADLGGSTVLQAQQISAVPLPSAAWLFGSAFIGLLGFHKKRQSR
ncbi:MAG: esterase-like activity of phytase family protein [Methylococcaceae bacterium]|nr:esterase-like activity of phytase family protein [Methylococcaceae bacterium]MDP3904259.1 esterase-like activity of phytase family protein [Methylococcaceae bacterium]